MIGSVFVRLNQFYATVENSRIQRLDSILQKDLIVKKFQSENFFVVYIGDGDNDFDAMLESDISIANEIVHTVPSRLKKIDFEYVSSVATVENNRIQRLDSILQKDLIVKKFQSENFFVVYIGDGDNDFD